MRSCAPGYCHRWLPTSGLPGGVLHSRAANRTPTLLLTFEGRDSQHAHEFLAARRINAPASSFYAVEASRWLGLADAGGLRIGLAPYSNSTDVDRLLTGIEDFLADPRP